MESSLFANHSSLRNIFAVIYHNHMQSLDYCENTIALESLEAKWESFGWNVSSINGNNHVALREAFNKATAGTGKPTVIIANTTKGYGISFMENNILWHYRYPHDGWEYDSAVNELHANMPEGMKDPYIPDKIGGGKV